MPNLHNIWNNLFSFSGLLLVSTLSVIVIILVENYHFEHQVWKLYRSNTLTEAVDPCLGDDYPATEASRVFRIGLLCTQASASLRPSISQVVYMLTNSNEDVPTPNQPPFLSTGMLDSDGSKSYTTNSFISNALKKIGVSYIYSESSSSRNSDGPSRSEESIVQVWFPRN